MIRRYDRVCPSGSQTPVGTAAWELPALLTSAAFETYIRLPEQLRSPEPVIRERLRQRLTRGKVGV